MKLLAAVVTLFVVGQATAFAALDAAITFKGTKTGLIKGDARDGSIKVLHFSTQAVVSEEEISHGNLAQVHRKWKPLVIRVAQGPWAQQLAVATRSAEKFTIDLSAYKPGAGGASKAHYQVHLTGATIVKVTTARVDGQELVEVSFTFNKITWTWNDGGKTFSDDWEARV